MKNYLLCVRYIFIFNLCWFFLALAEDAATPPPFTPPENVSSDVDDGATKTDEAGGSDLVGNLEPSVDVASSFDEKIEDTGEAFSKQLFAEATSQNSGVAANEISTSGQPVVVTLTDAATAELQQRAAIIPSQETVIEEEAKDATKITAKNRTDKSSSDLSSPELNQSTTTTTRSEPNASVEAPVLPTKENLTEEIPSFSEWAQKQLEEAEKNKESSNISAHQQHSNGKQGSGAKLRWKNYASLDCGAKVVASNPEAVSPSAILSPSRDEYKLNTCTSRIWFIVELCEAIQAKKIDLANFELFSSSPKDFVVSVSDRFPTREWSNVGQYTAKDERDVQSFDLHPHLFGKYIKVEVKSHYGSEHYCPISLFRVYGTSEFEVLQKEDPVHADRLEEDDDDGDESLDVENGDASKNLFSSATDAVISMVKKAAQVLGNKGNHSNQTEASNVTFRVEPTPLVKLCTCPSHLVVCDNCTDVLFGEVYELLSCKNVGDLVDAERIRDDLVESDACRKFGFDFLKAGRSKKSFVRAFFPERFLGAMCNAVAVLHNKVVLNVSSTYSNVTAVDEDKIVNIETSEPHVPVQTEVEVTDALVLDSMSTESGAVTKSTCSTDVSYVSQIKPTKTLAASGVHLEVTESVEVESSKVTEETVQVNATIENTAEQPEHQVIDVENVTESVEGLEDPLEHFISELNGEGNQLPNAQTTASTTPQAQKESVFLRLSNRIKALERNMSLSGQYLEELSKRYKKQVEEIQKLLDKTILSINEESKRKDEYNRQLEERLSLLTSAVEALVAERRSWSSTVYCVVVSSLVTLFIVSFCCNKTPEPRTATVPNPIKTSNEVKRRKSIDVVVHQAPQKKRRRPSDQALKIVRSSTETQESVRRRKKKKTAPQSAAVGLKRSNSIGTLSEESEHHAWGRQESAPPTVPLDWVAVKHVEEVPFVLEESEHSSLEPLDGMPRIVAPGFLKTAANSRAVRVNGDAGGGGGPKNTASLNGVGLIEPETARKERKGLKKIFKKVF